MLTHRQKECLDFIEGYIASTGGVSPSFDEIQHHLLLKSRSTVHRHVLALEERGFIRHRYGERRAIEIVARENVIPLVDLSHGQTYFLYDREAEALVPWDPP